jgi:hypothetical protein
VNGQRRRVGQRSTVDALGALRHPGQRVGELPALLVGPRQTGQVRRRADRLDRDGYCPRLDLGVERAGEEGADNPVAAIDPQNAPVGIGHEALRGVRQRVSPTPERERRPTFTIPSPCR